MNTDNIIIEKAWKTNRRDQMHKHIGVLQYRKWLEKCNVNRI